MCTTAYLSKSWKRFLKTNVDKSYHTNFKSRIWDVSSQNVLSNLKIYPNVLRGGKCVRIWQGNIAWNMCKLLFLVPWGKLSVEKIICIYTFLILSSCKKCCQPKSKILMWALQLLFDDNALNLQLWPTSQLFRVDASASSQIEE